MARFNEILVGRYNRFLQKLLSMKGGPVASQLASEISAFIPLFHGVENRYLEGWDEFGFAQIVPAVAAQNATLQIRNPNKSNVIAVFEWMAVWTSTADTAELRKGPAPADLFSTGVGLVMREDPRGRQSPSLIFSLSNAGNAPSLIQGYRWVVCGPTVLGNFIGTINQEVMLFPGDAIQLNAQTVNNQLQVGLRWRERALEDSEVT